MKRFHRDFARILALSAMLGPAAAQTQLGVAGDYTCDYGCRPTDVNPTIEVHGDDADCMNELGGLYRGKRLGDDGVACFRKEGRLSADRMTLTWSDGVIWKRHVAMRK